jgi:uncharacterized membrane-anchored protein
MMRRALIVVGLVASLGLVAWEVARKERLLASGETVLLELAPRDPRSLIQGDYMQLDYALARRQPAGQDWPRDGALVVSADDDGVAQFRRLDKGEPLAAGEQRLIYRVRGGRLQVGTNAFYFQEGTADTWAAARYGELRVGPDGTALLVGLMDAERRPLGTR